MSAEARITKFGQKGGRRDDVGILEVEGRPVALSLSSMHATLETGMAVCTGFHSGSTSNGAETDRLGYGCHCTVNNAEHKRMGGPPLDVGRSYGELRGWRVRLA